MADARYLIDIVLNARDNTSRAAQSALKNLSDLQQKTDELGKKTDEVTERMNRAWRKVAESETQAARLRQEFGVRTDEALRKQVELIKAAENYTRTLNEQGRKSRETALAFQAMIDAEKGLVNAIKEESDSWDKNAAARARASASALKHTAVIEEQGRIQAKIADDVAQAEEAANQRRIKSQQALNIQRIREEEETQNRLTQHRLAMSRQRIAEEEEMERRHIETQRALGLQRAAEEEESQRRLIETRRALNLQRIREEEEAHAEAIRIEEERHRNRERREREFQNTLRQTMEARRRLEVGKTEGADDVIRTRLEADVAEGEAKLHAIAEQMRELDGSQIDVAVELHTAKFLAEAQNVKRAQRDMQQGNVGLLDSFGGLFSGVESGSNRIAAFDNLIRGLFTLLITVFLQQLIQVGGAAVGMLLALGSSALQAGAALGGALVAGIGQAIPMLGVLATAISRVKGVFEAVQQANLLQEQQSYKGAAAADRQASALDGVRNAAEALADAQRRVVDAQERVNLARGEARRQLRDLILAEKEAELAAKGAALSQEEAQRALQTAIAEGRSGDIQRLQLGVEESTLDRTSANRRLRRTRSDTGTAVTGGVEGVAGVIAAKEALADAERSVVRAERGLARAQRTATQADANISAAAGKLNYLLANMTGTERRMYEAVLRLQRVWQGFARNVSEPMVVAFTGAISRVTEILQSDEIISSMRQLSSRMAGAFSRVFDAFTSPTMLRDFRKLMDDAGRNMKPLADIAISLGRAFTDIAVAAGPALRDILKWVAQLADDFARMMSQGRRSGELTAFFRDGVKHLKSWADLMWQIVRFFAAIAGAGGAREGKKAVDDMADSIGSAADRIGEAGSAANEFWEGFFKTSRRVLDELGPIFSAIGDEFRKTFNNDAVGATRGFATIMAEVVIPALGRFIRAIGSGVQSIGEFVRENPAVAKFATTFIALALTMGTVSKAFSALGAAVVPVFHFFRNIFNVLTRNSGEAGKLATAIGRISGAFSAVGRFLMGPGGVLIAIGLLLRHFGRLDDVTDAIGRTFRRVFNRAKPAVEDLVDAVGNLFRSFRNANGGLFMRILEKIAGVIADVLVIAFETLADVAGPIISNIIEVLEGVIEAFDALIRLDFGDFISAIAKIGKAILEGIFGALAGLGKGILRLFIKALDFVFTDLLPIALAGGLRLVSKIVEAFISLPGKILKWFITAFEDVGEFLETLPDKLGRIGTDIANAIANGIKKLPELIGDLFSGAGELAKNIAGAIMKFINDNTPFGDKIDLGITSISLPKLPETFAQGGPVPGTGRGDTVPALLTPGEHVWTKEEVERAGGHRIMFLLRRMLGGGTQGGPTGYALGGEAGPRPGTATVTATVNADADMGGFAHRWRLMWQEIVNSTRRNSNLVITQFRQMRVGIETSMNRLSREFHERWFRMSDYMHARLRAMVKGATGSMESLKEVVFDGMSYVGRATNSALRSMDADPVRLTIPRPGGERRATGGYLGLPGERGRDLIPAWLGRGEVVLNHWQQRVVNSMLGAQGTSLQNIVSRVRGFHAGGPDEPGFAGGYAGRGPDGRRIVPIPGQPGEYIAKSIAGQVVGMMRRFKLAVTDGFATSGHATNSDHYKGLAADLVPGAGGNWNLVDRAAAFARSRLGKTFRWIGYDGEPGHGRGHHLHLSWLADAAGLGGLALEQIKRLLVRGTGPLRRLSQAAIDKTRGAANSLLGGFMDPGIMEAHPTDAVLGRGEVMSVINRAMARVGIPQMIRAAWRTMAYDRARQESGFNPNAVNNWDINAKMGDPSRGLFQTIGQTFQAYALPGASNILNPLHNAMAAFRYMFARYGGGESWSTALSAMNARRGVGYASGGYIGGPPGSPQWIMAHAGEWVLNKVQQSKLARMLGMGTERLRAALGFEGGPTSFQGGGEVGGGPGEFFSAQILRAWEIHERRMAELKGKNNAEERKAEDKRYRQRIQNIRQEEREERRRFARLRPEQQRLANIRRGAFALGTPGRDFESVANEARLQERAQRNLRRRARSRGEGFMDRFMKNVNALLGDGGVLDQMGSAIDRLSNRMETDLNLARAGIRRVRTTVVRRIGNRIRRFVRDRLEFGLPRLTDEAAIAARQRQNSERLLEQRVQQRADTVQGLQGVEGQIARLRRSGGGISQKEKKRYEQLLAARGEFLDKLDELDADIAQNQEQIFADLRAEFEAQTAAALRPGQRQQQLGEFGSRVQEVFGVTGNALNASIQQQISGMTAQRDILNQRAAAAAAAGYQDLADQYAQEASDLHISILEAQQQILQNGLDEINNAAERALAAVDRRTRVATALGDTSQMIGLLDDQRKILSDQRSQLSDQLAAARAAGNVGMATEIADQIAEIDTQLVELAAERLNTALEQINEAAERAGRALDIRDRMASLLQAAGDPLGAAQARLGILQDRRSAIATQRNELYGLLAQANAEGNVGLVKELTDQIAELDAQLAENSQAISDQTVAIRQVSIDLIQQRQQFGGGITAALQNIINAVGAITGQLDIPALIAQVTRAAELLNQTATGLREQLLAAFGIDLTGLSGLDLVQAISSMNFEEIMKGMTEAQRTQFQELVNAILENEQAILANTQQLNELNGTMTQPQSWQSTSWQWFREAIFSGMGDVLPQYQVPQMQTGGYVTKTGLFNLHAGEFVVNPDRSNVPAGDHIEIEINEAGGPLDLTHLANRLAFAKKGAGG